MTEGARAQTQTKKCSFATTEIEHLGHTLTPMGFVWTQACEKAFEEIKQLLKMATLLRPPNMEKEFFLWTGVSEKGFRAVLEQEDDEGK